MWIIVLAVLNLLACACGQDAGEEMTMSASSVVTSPNFLEHALLMLLSHKLDTPVRAGAGVRTGPPVT